MHARVRMCITRSNASISRRWCTYIELLSSWAAFAAALPLADELVAGTAANTGRRLGNLGRLLCGRADGGGLRSGRLRYCCLWLLFGHSAAGVDWVEVLGDEQRQKIQESARLCNPSSAERKGALNAREGATQGW